MAFNKVICLGENDIFFCLPLFIGLIKTGKGFDLLKGCRLLFSTGGAKKHCAVHSQFYCGANPVGVYTSHFHQLLWVVNRLLHHYYIIILTCNVWPFLFNNSPDIYYHYYCPPGVLDHIMEHDMRFHTSFYLLSLE